MKLTDRQEAFCRLIVAGKGPRAAAVGAGYRDYKNADKDARVTMKKPLVAARIAELKALVAAEVVATQEAARKELGKKLAGDAPAAIAAIVADKTWVTAKLIEVVEQGMQAIPVTDRYGKPIEGEFRQNLAAANKALELIGKEQGMFVERTMNVKDPFENLTHEEIKALLAVLEAHDDGTSSSLVSGLDTVQPGRAGRVTH